MAALPYSRAFRSGDVCSCPPRAEPVGCRAVGFGKPAFVGAEDREQDVLHAQPGPLASATFGAGSRNYASRPARTDGDGYRPTFDFHSAPFGEVEGDRVLSIDRDREGRAAGVALRKRAKADIDFCAVAGPNVRDCGLREAME